jgi:predicted MFS family arabinose efflux permease
VHAGFRPVASRLAVLANFLANGVALGIWATRLPALKQSLALTNTQLAGIVFAGAFAAIASLRLAGPVIERLGSARVTRIASPLATLGLALTAATHGLVTLAAVSFLWFAVVSFQDVGMNSQALAVERELARPVMSSFHAAFSAGMIAGAAIGALTAHFAISYRLTFVVAGVALAVALVVASRWLVESAEPPHEQRRSKLPNRGLLLLLGAIALASFVAEGAATDWTAIYLRDDTGASAASAAAGLLFYNVMMTTGRLTGDTLAGRFRPLALVALGTFVGGAGFLFALVAGTTAAGFAGFGVLGLGLSLVVPQVFSAVGTINPSRAPASLSLISSISYSGFVLGPRRSAPSRTGTACAPRS